jgi:hypothetical protein
MIPTFSHMTSGPKLIRHATYTPRATIDLGLCIYKENKHISRINIYDNYKIVINSTEVHLGKKDNILKLGTKI